jgi:hypothetical protein
MGIGSAMIKPVPEAFVAVFSALRLLKKTSSLRIRVQGLKKTLGTLCDDF